MTVVERLCAVRDGRGSRLCARDGDGRLRPVAAHADVAALVAAHPDAATLSEAVDRAGLGPAWEGERSLALPVRPAEVWAAGVTYARSREARMSESELQADVYERVYDAERPELFLKATGPRLAGPGEPIGLRGDSAWQVPEPELGLVLGAHGQILGYTLGDDVSSRDIEGENPLYLPQAKVFAGSCSLGPAVIPAEAVADPYDLRIELAILREGEVLWEGATSTAQLHTGLERLVDYVRRDNWLPPAAVLLTGTGIVPDDGVTLRPGDVAEVRCPAIGVLANPCRAAAELPAPAGWSAPGTA